MVEMNTPAATPAPRRTRRCKFCGIAGHQMRTCPQQVNHWQQMLAHEQMHEAVLQRRLEIDDTLTPVQRAEMQVNVAEVAVTVAAIRYKLARLAQGLPITNA